MIPLNPWEHQNAVKTLYGKFVGGVCAKHGMARIELDILLFLANNPECDTARDIVEIRHLAKSHVSVGVDSLAERGLLRRLRLDGNRKTIHLRLTDAAAPIVEQGRAIQHAYAGLIFDGFSEAQRQELFRLLDRVSENVDAAISAIEEERNA